MSLARLFYIQTRLVAGDVLKRTFYNAADKEGFKSIIQLTLTQGGISQNRLAKEFEVSAATISRWNAGRTAPVTLARKAIVQKLNQILV